MDATTVGIVTAAIAALATLAVAMVNQVTSRSGPDTIRSQGERIDALYHRLDDLESKVTTLEDAATADRELRHRLRGVVAYLHQLVVQAVAYLQTGDTDGLPEPLRGHVDGSLPLDLEDLSERHGRIWPPYDDRRFTD